MKTNTYTKHLLTAGLMLSVCAALGFAQTKPDFSGTWKMNKDKSKFERGGPDTITIKIEQKEGTLSEVLTLTDGGNGERTVEAKYTADGKESDVIVGDQSAKGTIKWEGETLVISWKTTDFSFIRKCKLAADGKSMTIEALQSNQNGDTADSVVLEKQ